MPHVLLLYWILGADGGPLTVDYLRDVKPILRERCYACHGAVKQEAGLRLDTATAVRAGSENGPVIAPGNAEKSELLARVRAEGGSRMPPEGEGTALSEGQIEALSRWIGQGAAGAAGEKPDEDPRRHWAFQAPVRPPVPRIAAVDWVANPIDAFLAAAHEQHGLRPVPPASPEVLLRRVHLDLVGLPPTRQELRDFLADPSEDGYLQVVDRLLASPRYGERWGRHWMDVWRYSDWYGRRKENDVRNSFPHIWRWRDWIIGSLNSDKGYDRMVMEMLAADEVVPLDDSAIVATGFIVRSWFSLNYDQWMRDLVEHTGKAFLGLRLNCALCHDHKYDPITQEEYFRFRAFFEPLELRQDRVPGGPALPQYTRYVPGSGASLHPIEAGLARVLDVELDAKTYMYRLGDSRNRLDRAPVTPGAPAVLGGSELEIPPVDLPPAAHYPGLKPWIRQEEIDQHERMLAEATAALPAAGDEPTPAARPPAGAAGSPDRLATLQRGLLESQRGLAEARLEALRARIAADDVRYGGGDWRPRARSASQADQRANLAAASLSIASAELGLAQAETMSEASKAAAARARATQQLAQARASLEAAQGALAADSDTYSPLGPVYPNRSTGRRTVLARWIASPRNPLTVRVAVNHIWMRHFGRPLVESVFDFGRAGQRPTHPELLDWLAVELIEHGWSMKHLHRLVVTSSAYRMTSAVADAGGSERAADPSNRHWWHFESRRLEAEVLRDSILHCAGRLDPAMGGPELSPTQEPPSFRRSLYFVIHPEVGGSVPFLTLFDAPDPCDAYRRTSTIVPQQSLAMTNSDLVVDQGRLLARRLWSDVAGEPDRETAFLYAAFEQILCRPPTNPEIRLCRDFLDRQVQLYHDTPAPGAAASSEVPAAEEPAMRSRESLVRTLFCHDDFVSIR